MIRLQDLSVRAGRFCLPHLNCEITSGSYTVLMGKTGSGKTTILETICGLRPAAAGSIYLQDQDVTHLKPGERGIGFVPQDKALFRTLSVRDNLAFALTLRSWTRAEIERRVDELAQLLGIKPLLDRKPEGLSGGEAQRVALGRALAFHPAILCLDEPLSALDDETRQDMHSLLKSVREHTAVTTLHVTHHRSDAAMLADSILFLQEGRLRTLSLEELKSFNSARTASPTSSNLDDRD